MLTLVVVGFARTFYARPFFGAIDEPTRSAELPRHLMLHGLVMTSWFALVVTQTLLIAKRNVALHRRLGIAGAALAVLVVVVDMFTIVEYVVCREAAGIAITQQQQPVVVGDTLNVLVYFPLFTAGGRSLSPPHTRSAQTADADVLRGDARSGGRTFLHLVQHRGVEEFRRGAALPVPLLALSLLAYDLATRRRPHWATVCGVGWVALSRPPLSPWFWFNPAADAYVEWLRHFG